MHEQLVQLVEFAKSFYFLQQIAPLVVLFVVPALALLSRAHWQSASWLLEMLFESLGFSLPWNWISSGSSSNGGDSAPGSAGSSPGRRKSKKAREKVANGSAANGKSVIELLYWTYSFVFCVDSSEGEEIDCSNRYYPGLVNVSGIYCFLNSVLQVCDFEMSLPNPKVHR